MSFDTRFHLYNKSLSRYRTLHQTRKFSCVPFQLIAISTLKGNHCCDFFHHRLIWPISELHINEIKQYVLLPCVRLLAFNAVCLRSVRPCCCLCRRWVVPFVVEWHSFCEYTTCVYPYTVDRNLCCSQFGDVKPFSLLTCFHFLWVNI